ncbi:hypothetical protein D9M68_226560 [compost metagenome]
MLRVGRDSQIWKLQIFANPGQPSSLRELDAERTARQKSERTAEELRGELVAARSEARDAAVAQAEVRARLEAQVAGSALADRLASAEQAQRKSAHDLNAVQAELGAAQRRAERAEAEAALARQLLAELRVAPPGRESGRRRKAGGLAPTEKEAQSEKLDKEQGAPTAASNPDDGSDSSDDSNGRRHSEGS